MPLIKAGKIIKDQWVRIEDDSRLPAGEPALVSLERWREDRENLISRNVPIGVYLTADQPPALIADDLKWLDIVALEFPVFTDGRAFSYARLLRERFGYSGEVRATGYVLRDQLYFMRRCGFDAFEIPDGLDIESWSDSFSGIDFAFQPAADSRPTAMELRRRAL